MLLGLVLRQKQRHDLKLSTKNNEKMIRTVGITMLVVGFTFILYRFGVRVYELFNSNINIRLPFYYYIMDLPRSFASSPSSYTKLIVLRLVKDLPVFIASSISLVLFYKIVISFVKNKNNSKENSKYYKIIFISLFASSVLFNSLGLMEVNLLKGEFLYQYGDAVYTIALRSLTEPLLYGFFILLFKHYVDVAYKLNKSSK